MRVGTCDIVAVTQSFKLSNRRYGFLKCEEHGTWPSGEFVEEWRGCATGRQCPLCSGSGGRNRGNAHHDWPPGYEDGDTCPRCGGERFVHPTTDQLIES